MEETQLIEKFEGKLSSYKEDFEKQKQNLQEDLQSVTDILESHSNKQKQFEEGFNDTVEVLESHSKKQQEFEESFNYVTELLESITKRLNSLEEQVNKTPSKQSVKENVDSKMSNKASKPVNKNKQFMKGLDEKKNNENKQSFVEAAKKMSFKEFNEIAKKIE